MTGRPVRARGGMGGGRDHGPPVLRGGAGAHRGVAQCTGLRCFVVRGERRPRCTGPTDVPPDMEPAPCVAHRSLKEAQHVPTEFRWCGGGRVLLSGLWYGADRY